MRTIPTVVEYVSFKADYVGKVWLVSIVIYVLNPQEKVNTSDQRDVEKRREERYAACAASSSAAAATESLAFSPFPGVNLGLTPNERMKLEHAEKLARIIQLKTELEKEQNALRSIAEMIDTDNPF